MKAKIILNSSFFSSKQTILGEIELPSIIPVQQGYLIFKQKEYAVVANEWDCDNNILNIYVEKQ